MKNNFFDMATLKDSTHEVGFTPCCSKEFYWKQNETEDVRGMKQDIIDWIMQGHISVYSGFVHTLLFL